MTRRPFITSSSNQRLKALRRLARRPRRSGVIVVEGYRQVLAALEARLPVVEVYAAPELFLGRRDHELVERAARASARVHEVTADAFASIARETRPDGLIAVVERPAATLARLVLPPRPLVVIADAVERPGNLGTIVRTAAAAGASALVVSDGVTDPFNEATVRASVGTVFRLAVMDAAGADARAWAREHGLRVVVASPGGERPYWEVEYTPGTAIVVGSERHGVSASWLGAADACVSVPMPGPADSLNVAVAAGIVLFEAARQRRWG